MTTGFQFAHVDWFSNVGASKSRATGTSNHGAQRGRGWSNAEILAEATRKPGHCNHVPQPVPPMICYGSIDMVTDAIEAFIEGQKVSVRLKSGANAVRKARADSPSLAAGVISFPRDRINEWPRFRDHAIHELQERYADRLRCVLEHLDERHPHVHFYLVPRPGESFGKVHDGYEASRKARKASGNKIRSAFNSAMSAWQDWVHEVICGPFALARLGPGRSRMSRRAWELEQQKAALAAEQAQASRDRYDIDRRRRQLEIEQKVAKSKHADSWADIEKTRNNLGQLYASLSDQQRAVVAVEIPNAIELLETRARSTTKFRPR